MSEITGSSSEGTVESSQDESSEEMINIGSIHVPLWLFDSFNQESGRLLSDLDHEITNVDTNGISKDLVRVCHTLGSISRTLGVSCVADLGYALEEWLTLLYGDNLTKSSSNSGNYLLDNEYKQLFLLASANLRENIESVRNKMIPNVNADVLATLTQTIAAHEMQEDPIADIPDLNGWMGQPTSGFEQSQSAFSEPDWMSDLESLADQAEQAVLVAADHKEERVEEKPIDTPVAIQTEEIVTKKVEVPEKKETVVIESKKESQDVHAEEHHSHNDEGYFDEVMRLSEGHLPAELSFLAVVEAVTDDMDEDILSIFIEEASEIFSQIYSFIDGWKSDGGNANSESLKLLKRALHTLKGSSRMAGCMRFGSFIHNVEHIIEVNETASGIKAIDLPDITSLACDWAAQEVEAIQKGDSQFIRIATAQKETAETPQAEKTATVAPIKKEAVSAPKQRMAKPVEESGAAANVSSQSASSSTLRVPIERMEKMSTYLAQSGMIHQRVITGLGKSRASIIDLNDNLERLKKLVSEVEIQAEIQMQSRKEILGHDFDPLEFDRFTRLQELTRMVTENIHDISMVQGNMEKGIMDTVDAVEEQSMVTDDLRYEVMHSRLLPIQSLTMRMDRVVRQACRDAGKQADLIIHGEAEIDNGVLNGVITPLEHLIRNSIAHGIETPEKRKALGKEDRGSIILQVTQHGNEVHFELSDDGAGINRTAIENKARERGLLSEGDHLTQERANEMIFSSGFSTSEKVTQLSGRGVGMDVVRSEIVKMGGWIQLSSMEGEGTSFQITVPSYMALMSLAPVYSNGVEYCVPTSLVKDIRIMQKDALQEAYKAGSIEMEGVSVPLYNFSRIMNPAASVDLLRNNIIMILDESGKLMAFHVERMDPDVNLVVRPLHKSVSSIHGVIGASIGGEGHPMLIVDPIRMDRPASSTFIDFGSTENVVETQISVVKTDGESVKTADQILVMVVDDSLTVRKVTEKFLTREGYKVATAKDGMDALEKLQEYKPDIFLLDIEMPRMDGFELAAALNSMDKTREIPIIMISSRNIEKHQDHAKSLGVKEYLGKPYKENELLFHIQRLTHHVPLREIILDTTASN